MKKGFVVIMEVIMTVLVILTILIAIGIFLPASQDAFDMFTSFVKKVNYANQYGSSDIYYFDFPDKYRILQFYVDDNCLRKIALIWDKTLETSVAARKLNPKYAVYFPVQNSLQEEWGEKYILCIYKDTRNFPNPGPTFLNDNIGVYEDLAKNCMDFFSDYEFIKYIVNDSVVCQKLKKPIIDSQAYGFESIKGPWNTRNINFVKSEKGIIMAVVNEAMQD